MELLGPMTTVAVNPISKSGIGAIVAGQTLPVGFNTYAYQISRNAMETKTREGDSL